MSIFAFRFLVSLVAIGFSVFLFVTVLPPMLDSGDVIGAFAAGFVNPFAAGYAIDAISCWLILAIWVIYEASSRGIRHGWICLVLGVFPGVATGLGLYLLLRSMQLGARGETAKPLT